MKEWGSHPPLYSLKILARAPDSPLDPYYMAARAPGLARIWLSPNFGACAGLTFGPLLYGGAGAGFTFEPLLCDGAGAVFTFAPAQSIFTPHYDIRPG